MQRLTLDQVKPAFVLAKPAMDDKGRTLIAEGTVLTETHIEQLRRRNVTAIMVVGHPVETGEAAGRSSSPEARTAYLDRAFSRLVSDPFMMRFKQAFVEQVQRRAEREKAQAEQEAKMAAAAGGGAGSDSETGNSPGAET